MKRQPEVPPNKRLLKQFLFQIIDWKTLVKWGPMVRTTYVSPPVKGAQQIGPCFAASLKVPVLATGNSARLHASLTRWRPGGTH